MDDAVVAEVLDEYGFEGGAKVEFLVEKLHAISAVGQQLYHFVAVVVECLHAFPDPAACEGVIPFLSADYPPR